MTGALGRPSNDRGPRLGKARRRKLSRRRGQSGAPPPAYRRRPTPRGDWLDDEPSKASRDSRDRVRRLPSVDRDDEDQRTSHAGTRVPGSAARRVAAPSVELPAECFVSLALAWSVRHKHGVHQPGHQHRRRAARRRASGSPRELPPRGPHRSGRAELPHPAPRRMASLPSGVAVRQARERQRVPLH